MNDFEKARDEAAKEMGRRHANPILRSMYVKSRGEMAGEFAQLYSLGADWARDWQRKQDEQMIFKLAEALEGFKLGHEHAPNLEHTRAYGDSYGWCDYCQEKVSWGPGEAEQALAALEEWKWKK